MSASSGLQWLKILGLLGIGVVAVTKGPKVVRYVARKGRLSDAYNKATQEIDHSIGWDKLPPALGLPVLAGIRNTLRKNNLHDTATAPSIPLPDPVADGDRYLTARTSDGTFNDLSNPRMGAACTRFGRNFPIEYS